MPKYLDNFKRFVSSIGDLGRYGDTYIVHASKGETVVPTEVLDENPALRKQLFNTMRDMGIEPERYVVGNELNSINPVTGQAEFFGHKRFLQKVIPREIREPISTFTEGVEKAADKLINPQLDFIDDEILDPAGEFLEEQILDPAGEFLGEEVARPIRKFQSKITPNEIQFLMGKLGGIGGGKLGTALAIAAGITNPLLLAAIAATSAAAGDVAGDYFTTDENEEFEVDKVSAAFSALTGGLAAADAANPAAFEEIGSTGVRAGDAAVSAEQMRAFEDAAAAGQAALDAANAGTATLTTAEALQANEAIRNLELLKEAGFTAQTARDLTFAEGIAGVGRDFVAATQPYVDPFQGADLNPFSADFGSITGPTGTGTLTDVLSSGGGPMELLGATSAALVPGSAEAITQYGVDYYEAMQEGEDKYREYLRQRGLRADQIRDQSRRLRRQYYNQSFQNRGYSSEEIALILFREGLIDNLEDYDPNDLPQDRAFGENVTDDTLYAAKGGRVGFSMGSKLAKIAGDQLQNPDELKQNDMDIANYVEAQRVRENMIDKMKRGLGAMEMNMKLNDPGLFGRIRNVLNPMDDELFFYTQEEMRFPDTKKRYESMIRQMDEDRATADFKMRDKMDLVEDYMNRLDAMGTTGGMSRQKNAMGTRTTPEGDPISPDMLDGMQMDLRGGGFIPLGTKPKADDVPAMVGKNEFVLNDEAVSGIGKMLTGRPDPRAGARALYKLQSEMEAIV